MRNRTWADPPVLQADEVHLWWGRVDQADERETASESLLDPAERARADRFHRAVHRRRFRCRRSALRTLLGAYLARDPAQLRFREGPHGKPALEDASGLEFNLSHSEDRFLVAVARDRPLGVDLEAHRLRTPLDRMARQVFSPRELEAFAALPERDRSAAFFRLWTRKEALLKATGEGLAREPRTLDLGLDPDPPGPRALDGELEGWLLLDLVGADGPEAEAAGGREGEGGFSACLVAAGPPFLWNCPGKVWLPPERLVR